MRCAACGAQNGDEARSCTTCGAVLRSAGQPHAERRLVSILFVDLEDFTGIVEELDPEDAAKLQSDYFALARSVIGRYGGTLEKYIGDAVMAVWGAPIAREDDGERAVRAAIDTVAGIASLRVPQTRAVVRARASVASGEAAVTLGLDGQGMLAGDPVITAARLQAAAPPGGVMVDSVTRRLARRGVRFEPAGLTSLKGRRRPILTWLATGAMRNTGVARRAGHGGPFVGRNVELDGLLAAYENHVVRGHSRLVSLVGIAGIGKSRLLLELEDRLRARPDAPTVLVGRAAPYGEGRAFAPLAEIVRHWAGIGPRISTTASTRRLTRAVNRLAAGDERSSLPARLAVLLEPRGDVAFEREDLFAAWRGLFERIAVVRPAVLVFEDLQWADPGMLEFIEHICRWSSEHRLLVMALARREMLEKRPDWAAEVPNALRIDLAPLPDRSMAELLSVLAPALPAAAARQIVERAGGVPLYAVEYARLRAEGVEFHPGHLPETLRSLVSARIDALPADERRILLRAAVLGRRFDASLLAAVAGLGEAQLDAWLGPLAERQLLAVEDDPTDRRAQVAFVQDVVRDVAYRTLARPDRRVLHLAAADHLAARRTELVEEIGEHLYNSHHAATDHPAAGNVAQRAVPALVAAADRATALHVPARALIHLERALELTDDEQMRLELLAAAASAARAAAEFERAEQLLHVLIERHDRRGEQGLAARGRAQLASLLLAAERHGSALHELEAALHSMTDLDADPAGVELAGQLARAKVLVGDDEEAWRWADRTIRAARRLRLPGVALDTLITRGTASVRLGRDKAGLRDLRRAIAGGQRLGLARSELRARNNLAWLVVLDDPHETLDAARGGMELAEHVGLGDMYLQLALVRCMVAIDTGDWDESLAVMNEVRHQPQAAAHRVQFAAIDATIRALRGERHPARRLERLRPLARETDRQIVAAIDLAKAWAHFTAGNFAAARAAARRAAGALYGAERYTATILSLRAELWLGRGAAVGDAVARLAAQRARGRVAQAAEQTMHAGAAALTALAEAAALYDDAGTRWRALRLPLHLALCLAERDRLLADGGREEAEAILSRLGADGILRLLAPTTLRS